MTLPVVWIAEADADLADALQWYKNKKAELAIVFARSVDAAIDEIARNPLHYPVVYRKRRRAGIRRFPYGIFFEVEEERIVVFACFHGKRNPKHWRSR